MLDVSQRFRRARVILSEARVAGVAGGVVSILVKPTLLGPAQQSISEIEAILSEVSGEALRVEVALDELAAAAAVESAPTVDIQNHPLVKQAIELFGGKVISTGPRRKPPA